MRVNSDDPNQVSDLVMVNRQDSIMSYFNFDELPPLVEASGGESAFNEDGEWDAPGSYDMTGESEYSDGYSFLQTSDLFGDVPLIAMSPSSSLAVPSFGFLVREF